MIAKASYSSPQLLSSTAKSRRKRMSFNSKANKSLLLCVWDQIVQTEREICEEYKSKSQLFSLCTQVVFFIQFLTLPLSHSLTMFPCFSLKKNPMTHEPEGKFLQQIPGLDSQGEVCGGLDKAIERQSLNVLQSLLLCCSPQWLQNRKRGRYDSMQPCKCKYWLFCRLSCHSLSYHGTRFLNQFLSHG